MKKIFRKGMAWSYIVMLITVIAIIIVFLGTDLLGGTGKIGERAAKDLACQNSLASAQAYKPIKVQETGLIDKNDDFIHLKCSTRYEKTNEEEDKQLAFEAASLVDSCKKIYSRSWNLFDTEEMSVCIVCSSLEMPKNSIKEFIPHLKELRPAADPASNYLKYLFEVQDTASIESAKSSYYNLDTQERLAVVFVAGEEGRNAFLDMGNYGISLIGYKNLNSLNCRILEGETELLVIK